MSLRALRVEGHAPSLFASLMHFEVSFAIWVLLGALGPFIAADLDLSPGARGFVVAVPLLSAAVYRVLVGWLAGRYGPRRVGTWTMCAALVPLALGWGSSDSLGGVLAVGMMLGIAGASFAVALPLASSHYPAGSQGLVLGIAGAGNSGTIITGLLAPRIAEHVGWHATLGLAMLPVLAAAFLFRVLARESPAPRTRTPLRSALAPLRGADCRKACALYAVTFGGYVGFTSYLSVFLVDRFTISKVAAGTFTAAAAGAGSFARPVGGWLADRVGGARVLAGVYAVAALLAASLAALGGLGVTVATFVLLLGSLGAGNGAVFQLIPLRFRDELPLVTGIVGAAGGLGGFLLPSVMGSLREATGSYRPGFLLFASVVVAALLQAHSIRLSWRVMEPAMGEV
ncbi:MAG: MFS transporter [Actinomycetota bacterium]